MTRKAQKIEEKLNEQIKDHIEQYEEKMTAAMESGETGRVRQVYEDFEDNVGKQIGKLAQTADAPLKKALMSFFETPDATQTKDE
jgi:hypothetical protein